LCTSGGGFGLDACKVVAELFGFFETVADSEVGAENLTVTNLEGGIIIVVVMNTERRRASS
jgi:hypothetical protein